MWYYRKIEVSWRTDGPIKSPPSLHIYFRIYFWYSAINSNKELKIAVLYFRLSWCLSGSVLCVTDVLAWPVCCLEGNFCNLLPVLFWTALIKLSTQFPCCKTPEIKQGRLDFHHLWSQGLLFCPHRAGLQELWGCSWFTLPRVSEIFWEGSAIFFKWKHWLFEEIIWAKVF